jgi:PAS domain S-box-containing protein
VSSQGSIAVVGAGRPEVDLAATTVRACGLPVLRVPSIDALLGTAELPALVCLCLPEPEPGWEQAIQTFRAHPRGASLPLVVLGDLERHPELYGALALGADDVAAQAAGPNELGARIHSRLVLGLVAASQERHVRMAAMVLELTQTLSSTLHIRDILFLVVRRIAELLSLDRVSIVLTGATVEQGVVAVASDDQQLRDLPIRLDDYPEITQVLGTGQPLMIADSAGHPLFELTHTDVPKRFRSLTLFPILFEDRPMGVLFLRNERPRSLDHGETVMLRAVANATGIALRNARLVQSLRDESMRSRTAHFEAQRRVRSLERYADLFDSSADGIIVLDAEGQVLFCNPATCRITGRPAEELRGGGFEAVLGEQDTPRFRELRDSFSSGAFPSNVDLTVQTPSGESRVVSVAFNALMREEGNVIVSLRDVTHERALARELAHTKDFLQNVIDSSVDAIIAADVAGNVLVFNPAAERIFGHLAGEVIGRVNVRQMYAPGQARAVMAHILGAAHGGPGRLQGFRTEVVGKDGALIPVLLSAALIIHHDQPAGSVGLFTDLRAKLQIEARLAETQQELAVQERKAVIVELAGATAHELNQPLTAVMGYAELLALRLEEGSPLGQASRAIVREAERMADIVRKIGKLTKYETKPYVGETKIIDIDRAAESEPSGSGPPR